MFNLELLRCPDVMDRQLLLILLLLFVGYFLGVVFSPKTSSFILETIKKSRYLGDFILGWADIIYSAGAILLLGLITYYFWPLNNDDSQLLIFTVTAFTLFFQAVINNRAYDYRNRPKIKVLFDINKTDSYHMTSNIDTWPLKNGQIITQWIPTYYVRLRVENNGNTNLKNAQVVLKEILSGKTDRTFFPLNLHWEFANDKIDISHGASKSVNIFEVREPQSTSEFIIMADSMGGSPDRERHVGFSSGFRICSISPNTLSDIFPVGKFEFLLSFSADNAKPLSKKIFINYDGKWRKETDIKDMRKRHLQVRLIDR